MTIRIAGFALLATALAACGGPEDEAVTPEAEAPPVASTEGAEAEDMATETAEAEPAGVTPADYSDEANWLCLPGKANDVGLSLQQQFFGLLKAVNTPRRHDRYVMALATKGSANLRHRLDIAPPGALLIRNVRRHTLIAAASRVGVSRPPDPGLLGIVKLATPGQAQKIHSCASKRSSEK